MFFPMKPDGQIVLKTEAKKAALGTAGVFGPLAEPWALALVTATGWLMSEVHSLLSEERPSPTEIATYIVR